MSQTYRFVPKDGVPAFNPDDAFLRYDVGFRPVGYKKGDTSFHCIWLLGSEVITEPYFTRDFSDTKATGENDIPITLILRRQPDKSCFPDDDGIDTLTRYIHFVETPCEFLTHGDFKVLFDGEKDSVIIGVRNWDVVGPPDQYPIDFRCESWRGGIQFINFNRNSTAPPDTFFYGHSDGNYQFNSKIYILGSGSNSPCGGELIVNSETLEVSGNYSIFERIGENPFYRFKGRKIK
ncbi:MAG: hypothetical protein GC181_12350 [Bacteroidetes bacterium]|nr:hypothetical protein [Bacteroidota bacterium]